MSFRTFTRAVGLASRTTRRNFEDVSSPLLNQGFKIYEKYYTIFKIETSEKLRSAQNKNKKINLKRYLSDKIAYVLSPKNCNLGVLPINSSMGFPFKQLPENESSLPFMSGVSSSMLADTHSKNMLLRRNFSAAIQVKNPSACSNQSNDINITPNTDQSVSEIVVTIEPVKNNVYKVYYGDSEEEYYIILHGDENKISQCTLDDDGSKAQKYLVSEVNEENYVTNGNIEKCIDVECIELIFRKIAENLLADLGKKSLKTFERLDEEGDFSYKAVSEKRHQSSEENSRNSGSKPQTKLSSKKHLYGIKDSPIKFRPQNLMCSNQVRGFCSKDTNEEVNILRNEKVKIQDEEILVLPKIREEICSKQLEETECNEKSNNRIGKVYYESIKQNNLCDTDADAIGKLSAENTSSLIKDSKKHDNSQNISNLKIKDQTSSNNKSLNPTFETKNMKNEPSKPLNQLTFKNVQPIRSRTAHQEINRKRETPIGQSCQTSNKHKSADQEIKQKNTTSLLTLLLQESANSDEISRPLPPQQKITEVKRNDVRSNIFSDSLKREVPSFLKAKHINPNLIHFENQKLSDELNVEKKEIPRESACVSYMRSSTATKEFRGGHVLKKSKIVSEPENSHNDHCSVKSSINSRNNDTEGRVLYEKKPVMDTKTLLMELTSHLRIVKENKKIKNLPMLDSPDENFDIPPQDVDKTRKVLETPCNHSNELLQKNLSKFKNHVAKYSTKTIHENEVSAPAELDEMEKRNSEEPSRQNSLKKNNSLLARKFVLPKLQPKLNLYPHYIIRNKQNSVLLSPNNFKERANSTNTNSLQSPELKYNDYRTSAINPYCTSTRKSRCDLKPKEGEKENLEINSKTRAGRNINRQSGKKAARKMLVPKIEQRTNLMKNMSKIIIAPSKFDKQNSFKKNSHVDSIPNNNAEFSNLSHRLIDERATKDDLKKRLNYIEKTRSCGAFSIDNSLLASLYKSQINQDEQAHQNRLSDLGKVKSSTESFVQTVLVKPFASLSSVKMHTRPPLTNTNVLMNSSTK